VVLKDFPLLLRRAQRGDDAAFSELFRDTQPLVLRYLAAFAAPSMIEDIASDAWVSVIQGLSGFTDDDVDGFHAWVMTMARRRWIDEVRRRNRRPEVPTSLEGVADAATHNSVEDEVDQILGADAAIKLLGLLPPDQAEVVALRAVVGLDVERVAQIVGKTPGSVRVLSHRGLRRLAERLDPAVTQTALAAVED
jgi:RNA polymerase sigma-70 factor (ECF subfamily)